MPIVSRRSTGETRQSVAGWDPSHCCLLMGDWMASKSPEDTILDMTEERLAEHNCFDAASAKSCVDVLRTKGSALKAADVLAALVATGDTLANT